MRVGANRRHCERSEAIHEQTLDDLQHLPLVASSLTPLANDPQKILLTPGLYSYIPHLFPPP